MEDGTEAWCSLQVVIVAKAGSHRDVLNMPKLSVLAMQSKPGIDSSAC